MIERANWQEVTIDGRVLWLLGGALLFLVIAGVLMIWAVVGVLVSALL
jgi:hypothetical protein